MTLVTTSWATYGSGGQWRLLLEIDDPPTVTSATASVTLGARGKIQTTSTLNDANNSNVLTGDIAASDPNSGIVHTAAGGTTQVVAGSATIATVFGSAVVVDVTFEISGYEALTGKTLSGAVTVPARPYYLPAAPTGVSVARVSDASHTVSWTRNVTSSAPYSSQQVQRSVDGGAWATVATVSSTATSYTDTTTAADHAYAYRVVAVNSSGSTASTASTTVFTTPAAPGTPSATKSGSNIVLGFTNAARHDAGVKVYRSDAGGAFTLVDTVAAADLTAYTDLAPNPAQTHAYKVSTYVGALESALSAASPTVQLIAAPNAPTDLGPGGAADATESTALVWTHNPVDTTAQSKYQLRHRAAGSPTWVEASQVVSPVSSAAVVPATDWSLGNGSGLEWQVRTWGAHADPSPWSATSTLTLTTRPTLTLAAPLDGSTVDTSSLTVEWAFFDAESTAQTAWEVELYDAAALLAEPPKTGVGAGTSATMSTTLPDGSTWTVRARAQDGAGLWSQWDEAEFTVSYAPPPTPVVVLAWDPDTATVTVEITTPDPVDPEVDTEYVDVWRSVDAGPFELIATGVPPSTAVTDFSPTVAGTNTYRVDAVSALPSRASTTAALVTPQAGDHASAWVSGGPGFSQVCRATMFEISRTGGTDVRVLRRYAGRPKPVVHDGEGTDRVLTLAVDMIRGDADDGRTSPPEQWFALADLPSPHLWRDPTGRRLVVALSQVAERTDRSGLVVGLSVSATEVDDD